MPALPPAPSSSTAVIWQPLCSPSAHHHYDVSPAGLPSSSIAVVGVSLTSASSLRGPDSASARRPSGATSAPSSLASTVTRRSTSSTGLSHPTGSALVGRQLAIASGLLSSGCASSLRPTGSIGILPPASSTLVLSRSGFSADLRIFASAARALGSTLAPRILGIPLTLWLSVSTSGSSTTCSAAVGRPPGVGGHPSSMAPPTVGSTVGRCYGCGLGPAVLLLLRVPPVSSLSSYPLWSLSAGPLSGVRPLPEPPPKLPPVPPSVVATVRGRTFREGELCQGSGLSVCVFAPCDPGSPSCWLLIWFQVCLLSSSLSCVYKPWSIQLVFVGSWMSSLCSMSPIWIIKDSRFVNSSHLLVQCSLRSVTQTASLIITGV